MANRTITLSLKSNVAGLVAGVKTAQRAATDAGRDLDNFRKNNEQTWNAAGRGAVAFGTAAMAGLGIAAKAAIDWETAWAGVNKTVDGTPEQMAALEGELRELATTLPLTHAEIAGVAEAAGQLGIAREDIAGFTKTMIDLGVSTNLSAEEAATSIAQMMNVMQTAPDDVDNLGSALVALGNNGASTERDIIQMAQRLAGSAKLVGASEGEVLALANTMSSLGISAEMGGGAMSRVMQDIYSSVESGGKKLEGFAEVAGMTAEEFSTAFREDPIAAVDAFTQGLGRVKDEGGNVVGTLSELGIKSTEETRALLSMAGAGDMLAESLQLQGEAWEQNTALVDEANKRYETSASKIATSWNGIKDAAIDAGGVIVPVVEGAAEGVAEMAQRFAELPEPAQNALVVIGGLAGATSLAGGAAMLMIPKLQAGSEALRSIGPAGRIADKGIRGAAKGAGVLAVAFAAFEGVQWLNENLREGGEDASEMALKLENLASTGGHASEAMSELGSSVTQTVSGIGSGTEDYSKLADSMGILDDATWKLSGTQRDAVDSWRAAEDALVDMIGSGNVEQAITQFSELAESARDNGASLEEVAERFPEYTAAIMDYAAANGIAIDPTEALKWAIDGVEPKAVSAAGGIEGIGEAAEGAVDPTEQIEASLEEVGLAADGTVESLDEYLEKLFAAGLATMSVRDAQYAYEESLRGIDDTIKQITESEENLGSVLNKSKDDFNATTEAGALANTAFQDIAQSGFDVATAMAEAGDSQEDIQGSLQGTYEGLVAAANEFGITGTAAENLAREVLGVPEGVSIESWMSEEAEATAKDLKAATLVLPDTVDIDSFMSDSAYRTAELTKLGIENVPNGKNIQSYMEDDAFIEALETRAAVLGIPNSDAVSSFMSSAARGEADATTAEILGIPEGTSISSFMSSSARGEAESLRQALNNVDGRVTRSSHVHTITTREVKLSSGIVQNQSAGGLTFEKGGRLPGYADGGRLPYTGLGTDQILGISSSGRPAVRFDDGEWMIRETSARKYDSVLDRINRDHPSVQHLAGYANGDRVNRGVAMAQQFAMAPAMTPAAMAAAAFPSNAPREMVGTMYFENGALAGQVRMAAKDSGVIRAFNQGIARQNTRDGKG